MADQYEDIIAQCKSLVKEKGNSNQLVRYEDSNNLKPLNWTDKFLKNKPVKEETKKQSDEKLVNAITKIKRRIADEDFRERFPAKNTTTSEPRTEEWFEKVLSDLRERYSRCKLLVDELG